MSPSHPLTVAASHPAQNSHRSRGHVIVLPGRGEGAGLYERLGSRLSYDGYTVTILDLPPLADIDAAWLARADLGEAADEAGPVTLVGSDSGARLAAHLAGRLGIGAAVLAGIGGADLAADSGSDAGRIATRSSCPLYRGRLASGGADLTAPGAQRFSPEVTALLTETVLDVPVLAIHGEDDPITPLERALPAYRAVAPEAEIVTVVGGLHDILNDVTHRSVSAEIVEFLERRDGPVIRRLVPAAVSAAA